jgi:hypothetical protein
MYNTKNNKREKEGKRGKQQFPFKTKLGTLGV